MTELITITQKALQSQSWKMKAQGAAAMASIAKEQTGSLVAPHLGMVLSALLQGLAGRTWAGKVGVCVCVCAGRDLTSELSILCLLTPPLCSATGGVVKSHRLCGV